MKPPRIYKTQRYKYVIRCQARLRDEDAHAHVNASSTTCCTYSDFIFATTLIPDQQATTPTLSCSPHPDLNPKTLPLRQSLSPPSQNAELHREIDGPDDLDDKWGFTADELWVGRGVHAEFKVRERSVDIRNPSCEQSHRLD